MPFKFSFAAWIGAALAGMLALAGAAGWFRGALDQSFERGRAAGGAEVRQRYEQDFARRTAASIDALAQSQRAAAALETERDRLRDKFDDLKAKIGRSAGGHVACLEPDIVRALDELGRGEAGSAAGP